MARTVNCIQLKKQAEGLDYAPYPGELGKRIYNEVSKEAWQAWMKHQTMLVNENRLNLADLRARQYLARQMEKLLLRHGRRTTRWLCTSVGLIVFRRIQASTWRPRWIIELAKPDSFI